MDLMSDRLAQLIQIFFSSLVFFFIFPFLINFFIYNLVCWY
jgi:hypothetical protein